MSSPKSAKFTKKRKENTEKSFADDPTVDCDTKYQDGGDADRVVLKRSLRSKEQRGNRGLNITTKSFVIPRKNQQAKELLQSHNFDSREFKDLHRQINQYYRFQISSSKFKFEKVEFVNNSNLRKKYAEKKQEMRLELPKNRELEEKFGFVYTTSRSKVKDICEKGLQTGHCNLTFLGDPKLGVYVCRYADVVHKRPLDDKDKGYLIVFNVIKGKNKSIGGGNPEQQPTPHHDCHTSKLFTNLSSSATHGELYAASMFYFYEIDENSEEFHVKQPRQVLPYAVLTLSIAKVESPVGIPDKVEPKNLETVSRKNENRVSSPFSEDLYDNVISASTVSWAGQLFFKNQFIAFVNLVTYSSKKLFLPDYIEKINICKKISLDHLKSVFKCPIFLNGKPSSTRVSREFSSGGMFTYYEVQPIHDERERFNRIMTHFIAENTGALIEYIAGVVYMYIVPTSQLTHDAGITDEKSPSILHVLVHVKRICPFPALQDKPVAVESSISPSSEESISVWVQEILKEKLKTRPKKKLRPPSLFSKEIIVNPKQNVDGRRFITVDSVSDQESRGTPESKRKEIGKGVDSKAKLDRSNSLAGHDNLVNRIATSSTFKKSNSSSSRSMGSVSENDNFNTARGQDSDDMRIETTKLISIRQRGESNQGSQDKNLKSLFPLDKDSRVKFCDVQKLIIAFQKGGNRMSNHIPSDTVSPMPQDQKFPSRHFSNTNNGRSNETRQHNQGASKNLLIATPPLPPPLPSTMSPYVNQSPVPSTPDPSNKNPPSESLYSLSTLPATKNEKPEASNSELSSSVWPSPPSIERKSVLIPGLEPPSSPVFDLIKEKQVLSLTKRCKGNIDHPSSYCFPTPSQAKENKQMSSMPIAIPSLISLVSNKSLCESRESRSHSIQKRIRPPTAAEQASAEAREKVMSILQQSAQIRTDTQSIVEDNKGSDTMNCKSILKTTANQYVSKNLRPSDESKKDPVVLSDVSTTKNPSLQENKESSVKVVSLNHYWNKVQLNASLLAKDCERNGIKAVSSQSQATQEFKNGLDLIDKLFSQKKGRKDQDPSVANSEASKELGVSDFKGNPKNKALDCKGLPFEDSPDKSTAPKKRRRIVTVKRRSLEQKCGYDDMTSDISDEELPEDKITSDISDTELPDDYTESDNEADTIQREKSKSLSLTDRETRVIQAQRRLVSAVTRSTQKKARSPLQSPSRGTPQSLHRSVSRSISPDDLGRERKRRKTEMEQKGFQEDICDRLLNENDSNSGSNMSISPINSPVSFEYANDGTYHSIDSIPEGGRVLGGMSMPRSPKEVGRLDSPGTPETAVPTTDFLHANVGYWSTGIAAVNSAALPYGTLGCLETQVDKFMYEQDKQDNVDRYESGKHGSLSHYDAIGKGNISHYEAANQRGGQTSYLNNPTRSKPYHGENLKSNSYCTEELRVDSRGEGHFASGGLSTGEGSGYDSPSFIDSRRPFFGTTEDLILTAYDKNVNICTDYDYKCMDECFPPSRLNELHNEGQERCYVSRSPYEEGLSPGSPACSTAPEFAEMPYASDRRIVTVGGYQEYENTPRSDDEDSGPQQHIDGYGNENDPYCVEGIHFSGQELREYDEDFGRACQVDQQYYDVDEDSRGVRQSNQHAYNSDYENVDIGDDTHQSNGYDYDPSAEDYMRDTDNYNSADEDYDQVPSSSNRQNYNSRDEDYYVYSSPTNLPNYSSGDEDYSRDSLISTRENFFSKEEDYRREARPLSRENYNSENEHYVLQSRQSSLRNYKCGNEDYTRNTGKSSRNNYNSGDENFARYTRRPSRKNDDLEDGLYKRGMRTYKRDNYNTVDEDYERHLLLRHDANNNCSDDDGYVQDTRPCEPVSEIYNPEDEDLVQNRRQSNRDHCTSGGDDHAWSSRRDNESEVKGRARDTHRFHRGHYESNSKDRNSGKSPAIQPNCNSENEVNERSNHRNTPNTQEYVICGHVTCDSKDRDHEYLDAIAKENIDKTTLNFDNIVFEGLRNFPSQLLNLLQTHCDPDDSNGLSTSPDSSSEVQRENQCWNDKQREITSGSIASKDSAGFSVVSTSRDPRLNRSLHGTDSGGADTTELKLVEHFEKDASGNKIDQPNVQIASRVQSYFYVYEPENDNECTAVKNYMLKTGSQLFDVRKFDAAKLKAVKGGIRILIRGKHKSALHKINNLSKLKCLRNVKFALFNTVEDVTKKTRGYTAIFQYGGVLIPDDFILKRIHPAYLEALLRFMAEENQFHQKVFWVMNIRYQAYKKLGAQRPLTWRDTFVLDLLRKYRNEGFVNIIQKDYVTEGLSLIQRYLDTAWRQQRDLMATYRHFIMLSNLERQKSEASWFRNRGIGFMDIKTFLLGFAGDRKTKDLLFSSRFSGHSNTPTTTSNKNPTDIESHDRPIDTLVHKPSMSAIASCLANSDSDESIKEKRLEILTSIKNKVHHLNKNKESPNVQSPSENILSSNENNEETSADTVCVGMVSKETSIKPKGSNHDTSSEREHSLKEATSKDAGSNAIGKTRSQSPCKGSTRQLTQNSGSLAKGTSKEAYKHSRTGSPTEVFRSRVCSLKGISRNRACSPKKTTRKRVDSPKDDNADIGSEKESSLENQELPRKDLRSNKEISRKDAWPSRCGITKETNGTDEDCRKETKGSTNDNRFNNHLIENKERQGQMFRNTTWSRKVRSVVSESFSSRRGGTKRANNYPRHFVKYGKRRFVQERTVNHQ